MARALFYEVMKMKSNTVEAGVSLSRLQGDHIKRLPRGLKLIFSVLTNCYYVVRADPEPNVR